MYLNSINCLERGVPYARPGESVRIRCKGIENESDVTRGNILCSNDDLCAVFNTFEAEIQVLELQEQQLLLMDLNVFCISILT